MKKKPPSPDTPLTDAQMQDGEWWHGIENVPPSLRKAIRKSMGRPRVEHPKEKVTVRLDHDLLAAMRASGRGWQTEMNSLLRKAVLNNPPA